MEVVRRWLPLLLFSAAALVLQYYLVRWLSTTSWFKASPRRRAALRTVAGLSAIWVVAVPSLNNAQSFNLLPRSGLQWMEALTLFWGAIVAGLSFALLAVRHCPTDPRRRAVIKGAIGAIAAFPAGCAGAGVVIARGGPILREVDVPVRGLHPDLSGLRIAQLTDIHYGPFFGRRDLERAVAIANENKPHLTVVTGDLITRRHDDIEECIALLRQLRADAGVYGCHGNHEIYAGIENRATLLAARVGIQILRRRNNVLRFGGAKLNLAGYDYQQLGGKYLPRAETLIQNDALNVLLSHNPDVFPVARRKGFDLTLAGHTHGGQVNVEILNENLNVARFFTPYVIGLYEEAGSHIYVSAGLGTVGAPIRLGAPPEVTLIRLCAV